MTTLAPQTVKCALCGQKTEIVAVASTNEFGSCDLDLRPPPMARDTLKHQVFRCSNCGFSSSDLTKSKKGDEASISCPEYLSIIEGDLPEVAKTFCCAAIIASRRNDLEPACFLWLGAAWVCDDQGDNENACHLRSHAAVALQGMLDVSKGNAEADDTTRLVLIDVLRRTRRFTEAAALCQKMCEQESGDFTAQLAAYQLSLVEAEDDQAHRVDELPKGAE